MKKLVIMAGLPGSGKSYIRNQMFSDLSFIDCDELKKGIEGYDPKNPGTVHAQSKVLEKQAIYNYLANGTSFVYDTTASNADKVIKMTKEAQELGYRVVIVYVRTTLATALYRNSRRERVVPEQLILEKHSLIKTSMETVKMFADEFIVVDND